MGDDDYKIQQKLILRDRRDYLGWRKLAEVRLMRRNLKDVVTKCVYTGSQGGNNKAKTDARAYEILMDMLDKSLFSMINLDERP